MGPPRPPRQTFFDLTSFGKDIEMPPGRGESPSNPGSNSRQNSRNTTPANLPGKMKDLTTNYVQPITREDAISLGRAKAPTELPRGFTMFDPPHLWGRDAAPNPANNSGQTSRDNTPANPPGKKGDYEQATNASPTASNDQVDDRKRFVREACPWRIDQLLNSYAGAMNNERRTPVFLITLRSDDRMTHPETFEKLRKAVLKRLGDEIHDWRRADASFIPYKEWTAFSGVPTLITEYMEGTGARQYLAQKPRGEKRRLILEFARALKTLHRKKLSHGSIEPRHFIVDKRGKAKVGGYCFNRMVEEEFEKLYHPVDYGDSTRYVAPEFLESRKTDEHTDVYSFGLVAMELWIGVKPFASVSQGPGLVSRIKHGAPLFTVEDLARARTWGTILRSCWEEEPEDRPSMQSLYDQLSSSQ